MYITSEAVLMFVENGFIPLLDESMYAASGVLWCPVYDRKQEYRAEKGGGGSGAQKFVYQK